MAGESVEKAAIYQQIADAIHRDILYGVLKPGDRLPSVRSLAGKWRCTPGTVQRAYHELSRQGLVISRPGQGTHVLAAIEEAEKTPLRRAALVHKAEKFLLEALTSGHTPSEIEQSVRMALDRWRTLADEPRPAPEQTLRFFGSHDPAVALIAARFPTVTGSHSLSVSFVGSVGGLMALAKGDSDLAGSHLWDEEHNTYNEALVRRLFGGHAMALLTLGHRRLGLITQPGNPLNVRSLDDLTRSGTRFVNRQHGAGTRVWLDAHLQRAHITPTRITGYEIQMATHSEVARRIAENEADVGLGVEAAALAYGLDFVVLTQERYDLVMHEDVYNSPPVRALQEWMRSGEGKAAVIRLGGYDTQETGQVIWVT